MNVFKYSIKETPDILKDFGVDESKGLCEKIVLQKQIEYGENSLDLKNTSAFNILLRQFKSSFIYLLFGAVFITLFLKEYIDALMIFTFIFVNTVLGFLQEYRSEKTVKLLNKFTLPRTKVLRDGVELQIVSTKLVPGDIIILETGDKVPADVRIIQQNNLIIDESVLTGESLPIYKRAEILKNTPKAYHEATNLGFFGTDVIKGRAVAVVLAIGKNTAFGQIAKLSTETRKISDFEKGINSFSKFIINLVGITLFVIFLANIYLKKDGVDILELIIFSVALTVSVIPEALPLVTTFSLSRGAHRLAKNKVIVKRLSAIEDLGAIEVLCTDKTGTLTKNKLTISSIKSNDKEKMLVYANIASSFELEKRTEPFDIALEKDLSREQKKQLDKIKKIIEEPFDPKCRRNVVLVRIEGKTILVSRGAYESISLICSKEKGSHDNIKEWVSDEGRQGNRVIAVAYKEINELETPLESLNLLEQNGFHFLGAISFTDPIKTSSYSAVKRAKELGVRIIVLTGDSIEVSGAVGHEIDLINDPKKVMSGEKWEKMDKDEQLHCLDNYSVFARVSPEQKYNIIKFLQEKYVVGFLGEGINDAPALKIANVSLVVDSASDIAREAADIVLLKKNLKVIFGGIEEGRQVFANTSKYIKSTLASNFGNFFAVAMSSLLINYLPMLPIQILLLNLLSDTPMISISTDTVDKDELTSPKKYEAKDIIIIAIILGLISTVFDFILFSMFYKISPGVLQTNWFVGSILTELALIFSIRTKSLFIKGTRPSKSLMTLSMLVVVITISFPYTSFGQNVFSFVPPTLEHLCSIVAIVLTYFICSEAVKLMYYKKRLLPKVRSK